MNVLIFGIDLCGFSQDLDGLGWFAFSQQRIAAIDQAIKCLDIMLRAVRLLAKGRATLRGGGWHWRVAGFLGGIRPEFGH